MNFMKSVVFLLFAVLFLLDLVQQMLIFQLDYVLPFQRLLLIGPFPRAIEESHVEIGGFIKTVFLVYDGLNTTEIARVLIVLREFIV